MVWYSLSFPSDCAGSSDILLKCESFVGIFGIPEFLLPS